MSHFGSFTSSSTFACCTLGWEKVPRALTSGKSAAWMVPEGGGVKGTGGSNMRGRGSSELEAPNPPTAAPCCCS